MSKWIKQLRTLKLPSILLLLNGFQLFGQSDSVNTISTLDIYEILEIVEQYHPIMQQAKLQTAFADAEIRTAKGLMDPKLGASFNQKRLNDQQYYQKFGTALKIPVWFPIDPKVEVYNNKGQYLNDENFVSDKTENWQVTTGVSIPIGKGLFIDERRSTIRQANLFTDLAEAEQIKIANKTSLTVIKDYWEWYFAFRRFLLMEQSIQIADELFRRTKQDFDFGEAAVIDTIQAQITLQSRQVDYEKAKLELRQTKLQLSVHLWGPNKIPVELSEEIIPEYSSDFGLTPADSSLQKLTDWAMINHPEILKLQAKQKQLEIERKWNRESLKPEINLSYSLIDAPFDYRGSNDIDFDNYKLGVDFSFPLFLRKERGKLQKTELYIQSTEFGISQTEQEVSALIQQTYAELRTSKILAEQYQNMAVNYERLLEAEIFNLESGESDLFKLNIQQDKYLEAQRKYFDADLKFQKLKATLPYVIGLPDLDYRSMYE
ncbi:MAG: TolC family protein [Cyclobacteriaceae bacterium]